MGVSFESIHHVQISYKRTDLVSTSYNFDQVSLAKWVAHEYFFLCHPFPYPVQDYASRPSRNKRSHSSMEFNPLFTSSRFESALFHHPTTQIRTPLWHAVILNSIAERSNLLLEHDPFLYRAFALRQIVTTTTSRRIDRLRHPFCGGRSEADRERGCDCVVALLPNGIVGGTSYPGDIMIVIVCFPCNEPEEKSGDS
mmetsp:Transcript_5856/g.12819  ORF Transcript_5856/g.12819 Transcript_5856/m.12819 type:complete len:197 (+) Transcript_5856:63-653(+)